MAMTTTQKAGVAAGITLLGLFLGGAAMTVLRHDRNAPNSGFFSLWSKPADPIVGKMTAAFIGSWSGEGENINPANGQVTKRAAKMTFSAIPNGLGVDMGDMAPGEQYVFDAAKNLCTKTVGGRSAAIPRHWAAGVRPARRGDAGNGNDGNAGRLQRSITSVGDD